MRNMIKLTITLALLSLLAGTVFAAVPTPRIDVSVSVDTQLNTMTWNVKNLTDDSSGFKLVRLDWLYPVYDVSNVAPNSPWVFAKYQLAPDEWNGNVASSAVSWITTVANGLAYNQSMSFTIHSVPPVIEQQPMPLHTVWQRSLNDTPNGEPSSMDIGVIPEPSSMLVLATGLVGFSGLVMRKRR